MLRGWRCEHESDAGGETETGASVECGAPHLRRVQNEPFFPGPGIFVDGRREGHSSFPAPKRHNASRGQTRRDGDDACLRVLAALAAGLSPRAAAACADAPAKFAPLQPVRAVRRVGSRDASHVCSHDTPISEGPHDSPRLPTLPSLRRRSGLRRNPTRSNGSSVGPRFVSRARSRAPAGRRPRRRLARDPRDLAPKHEDIVRLARLLGFPPSRRSTRSADDAPAPIAALLLPDGAVRQDREKLYRSCVNGQSFAYETPNLLGKGNDEVLQLLNNEGSSTSSSRAGTATTGPRRTWATRGSSPAAPRRGLDELFRLPWTMRAARWRPSSTCRRRRSHPRGWRGVRRRRRRDGGGVRPRPHARPISAERG